MNGPVSFGGRARFGGGAAGEVLRRFVDRGAIVGGVVLVARAGVIVEAAVEGWADQASLRPVTRDTVFRLASLTKLVVSVTALRLVEDGVLDLDAPVSRWLPSFRPRLADGRRPVILLRHLLTHTAGLGYGFEMPRGHAYEQAGVSDGLDTFRLGVAENLRRLATVPLLFEPGSDWRYSLATEVVGAVIEAATERGLDEVVARVVLAPLGMASTGFRADPERGLATPYWPDGERVVALDGSRWLPVETGEAHLSSDRAFDARCYPSGGAGLVGTADDFMRLLLALRAGGAGLLSARGAAALVTGAIGDIAIPSRGAGWTHGLGAMVLCDPVAAGQRQGAGTWGWCGVYGGHYWVDPVADLALVALTNTGVTGAWGPFAEDLVAALYGAA